MLFFLKYSKNEQFFDNTRVGKAFFEEKMANLKVFFAKVCEAYRRQHFIHENS